MKNLTDQFTKGLYTLSQKEFSNNDFDQAKKCLLDYLGATFAGASILKNKSTAALVNFEDSGDVPIIGINIKSTLQNAILFNGIHSHVVELDDGHRVAMMHPGAPIISALLPLVQKKNISGNNFLRAIIVGYEASIRLGCALQPSLKEKGFHCTGITGTVGVAVAIATAMKFTETQFKDAIAAASTSASGILKVIKDVSELKPYNVGNASQSGYVSAMLAVSGFKSAYDTFGDKLGFLAMFSDNRKEHFLEFKENDILSILKIYRKPYAACRHCHSPIEAVLLLKEAHQLQPDDIKSINVKTYYLGVAGHEHRDIVGINSAKMSTPYSIAVALTTGKAGLSEFTEEVINDKNILALTHKVTVVSDDELTALVPQKRVAVVSIETNEGQSYTQRVDYPKGEPESPLSDEELIDKFISLAQFSGKSLKESQLIIQIINDLEKRSPELFQYL